MKNGSESQTLFNPLPAVAIGGPPHSGKSVLAYSLTQTLREMEVPHYLLRAYPPDYEGDWFHEGDQELVRHLRIKGSATDDWVASLRRDVARRHLPLLVDMGGLPTPEQESILDCCTHGVLLTPTETAREEWAERFARHGLVLLADLRSDLHGENRLERTEPVLEGTLKGLERGSRADGPAFEALVARLADLFRAASHGLRRRHLESAPIELVVDLDRLARSLGRDPIRWQPEELPTVLDHLPPGEPLALYGRGPNWLYAATAAHTLPAPFWLFDARLGWVEAPAIRCGPSPALNSLVLLEVSALDAWMLSFFLPSAYLDITDADRLAVPPPLKRGTILSGKLPLWLWAALARSLEAPWVAVTQPQLPGAVVVRSPGGQPAVGTVIPLPGFAHPLPHTASPAPSPPSSDIPRQRRRRSRPAGGSGSASTGPG